MELSFTKIRKTTVDWERAYRLRVLSCTDLV